MPETCRPRRRIARAGEVAHRQRLYPADLEDPFAPIAGYCTVCERRRPIRCHTISNFGCGETEADREDCEFWNCNGERRLECLGCAATCIPIFWRGNEPKLDSEVPHA